MELSTLPRSPSSDLSNTIPKSTAKTFPFFISRRSSLLLCSKQKHKTGINAKRKQMLRFGCRSHNFCAKAASGDRPFPEDNGNADKNEAADKNVNTSFQNLGDVTRKFYLNFEGDLKREAGIDLEPARILIEDALDKFRLETWPRFVAWNHLERWKEFKNWDSRRLGALFFYIIVIAASFKGVYLGFRRHFVDQRMASKIAEAYLESFIPDPTPSNIQRLKKGLWRRYMPEGFKVKKYIIGADGSYHLDNSYVGQDPWEEDPKQFLSRTEKIVGTDRGYVQENNQHSNDGAPKGEVNDVGEQIAMHGTWQERLAKWTDILEKEKWQEDIDALTSKYVITFDWNEMKENFLKDQENKRHDGKRRRAEWISKRWWQYRPKLPYTYFLRKVESLEVEAVVFTEDLRKVYVTMKEGFPSEYIVDIPVDPFLFELLERCGVETDTYIRSSLYYLLRGCAVVAPALIFMWYLGHITNAITLTNSIEFSQLFIGRKIKPQRLKRARDRKLLGYGDAIYGGDVWVLLDEIMQFMENAEDLHAKGTRIPRGVLISGPPGTGKTHLVQTIAAQSGYPFFFATGASLQRSFTVANLFHRARKWGPAFIFIDEIDALAGRAVSNGSRKQAFNQLLVELDYRVESKVVDTQQFSSHGVMVLYATNTPEDLDERFVQPGYVDREIYIGFPGEKERISLFSVHSRGRPLGKDVDFSKITFRTSGFTGADIRSLINDAGIMAGRKGHRMIYQQDIVDALDKELFENSEIFFTEEEQQRFEDNVPFENRRLLAVHEAGHILLAHLFPRFDLHAFTFLFAGGEEEALSLYYAREEMIQKGYPTVGYLKMQMIVAHGGRCAEKLILNEITDQGFDDLETISHIARELVISPGNPRLGLLRMTWSGKFRLPFQTAFDDPEEALEKNEWREADAKAIMSVELSELFTREVTRYIEETEETALAALQSNRNILERLVDELLRRSKISGEEVENIIKSMDPVMLPDLLHVPALELDNMDVKIPPNFRGRYKELNICAAPLHRC
eukprot:TRINITY_DN33438_c0_g1_i1.p1 TRINITY_DN33438_c0_g1~~TRINITY_DN33438_c0_g1_i1.p1  ORF type:complete len:1020 (-),score=228.37 TRINITY_DN33438_c0_g1_i1:625-3684(-)